MGTSHDRHPPAGTSAITTEPGSSTSVVILAANANRLGATIVNASNARLFVREASGPATIVAGGYTKRLEAGETIEVESGYTGIINGIWAPAIGIGGFANITEFTP